MLKVSRKPSSFDQFSNREPGSLEGTLTQLQNVLALLTQATACTNGVRNTTVTLGKFHISYPFGTVLVVHIRFSAVVTANDLL